MNNLACKNLASLGHTVGNVSLISSWLNFISQPVVMCSVETSSILLVCDWMLVCYSITPLRLNRFRYNFWRKRYYDLEVNIILNPGSTRPRPWADTCFCSWVNSKFYSWVNKKVLMSIIERSLFYFIRTSTLRFRSRSTGIKSLTEIYLCTAFH